MIKRSITSTRSNMDIEEGSTLEEEESSRNGSASSSWRNKMSFVDYVPPPPRPVPTPAKYKLWLMILCCVYFASWFAAEAGLQGFISRTFRFSDNASLLVVLIIVVGVHMFGVLDLLVLCLTMNLDGKDYGLGPWLKQPRVKWLHGYTNWFVQLIAKIVVILEDGFALFNVSEDEKQQPKQFDAEQNEKQDVVLKIEHRIRPDKMDDYQAWRKKLIKMGCHARPGMKDVESVEKPQGDGYDIYLTFTSVDMLNEYMTSPVRDRIVKKLQPLLAVPSVYQLQKDRVLPDAFTDLCEPQGQPVPKLTPKKWKVWTITTMGLWFVYFWTNATLPFYYEQWGLVNAHVRAQALVGVLFTTFLNSYVMTPFLTMIFGNWLKRKENEMDTNEPWRTLNDGFVSPWSKAVLGLAYYGGCGIALAVNASK